MKPQDIAFIVVLGIFIFFRKCNYLVIAGLLSLLLAAPLFAKHIFFTAQHLTYYAVGFFLVGVIFKFVEINRKV